MFDPDKRLAPGDDMGFVASSAWWNGLLEHLRRGFRLVADPATGLQVLPGTDATTIALAGSYPEMWARAASSIPGATGATDAQMGAGTVRLWSVDAAGLRSDTGIDVPAYNGSPASVASATWLIVRKVGGLWTVVWEDCG